MNERTFEMATVNKQQQAVVQVCWTAVMEVCCSVCMFEIRENICEVSPYVCDATQFQNCLGF